MLAIAVAVPLVVPAIDLGGPKMHACIIVIVASHYLVRLYVRLRWWLYLHCVIAGPPGPTYAI